MTIRAILLLIGTLFCFACTFCWLQNRNDRRLLGEGFLFLILGGCFLTAGGLFAGSSYPKATPLIARPAVLIGPPLPEPSSFPQRVVENEAPAATPPEPVVATRAKAKRDRRPTALAPAPAAATAAGEDTLPEIAEAPPELPRATQPADQRAMAAAVKKAQRGAVARYPELGVAGSRFNTRFLVVYDHLRVSEPEYFRDPSWPLQLAEDVARDMSHERE